MKKHASNNALSEGDVYACRSVHVYHDIEDVANKENLQAAIASQEGEANCKMNGRVWWDKP